MTAFILGLMVLMATSAKAGVLEDGGQAGLFLVGKEGALAKWGVTFSAFAVGAVSLLVPGRVDILCETDNTIGEFVSDKAAFATTSLSACTTWQPSEAIHKTKISCTVKEPIVIETQILPKKHENQLFVLLEGEGLLTTIFLEGPECPLTKENKLSGAVHAQVLNNDTSTPSLLFNQEIAKLFQPSKTTGTHLKFGAFEAFLDAHMDASLLSVHAGKTLGVC